MTGHPQIILNNFKSIDHYFGLAHVAILPPRGLFHPVSSYRYVGKLLFQLCRSCAETQNTNICSCSEANRSLYGTNCTYFNKGKINEFYLQLQSPTIDVKNCQIIDENVIKTEWCHKQDTIKIVTHQMYL